MKFQNGNIKHENNNKNRLQIHTAPLIVSIALLVIGFITAPSMISAQNSVVVPGITSSNNTTGTSTSNATVATPPNATAANATKPVDGYNTPIGHLSAIRHVFDDPALRVQHYCKPNDKIVLVCQLYDSTSKCIRY
jgi:hypothetical protein